MISIGWAGYSRRLALGAGTALIAALLLASPPALARGDALPRATPESVGLDPARLTRIATAMQGYVERRELPGGVVLVARHGKLAYELAFGESHPDTIFRIASQSKALTSTGIMLLVEEGRIALSDPLSKFIPQFAKPVVAEPDGEGYKIVPAKREITIRDLLTHTSGLGYGVGIGADRWKAAGIQKWYFADRDEPMADIVARMGTLPLESQPGEKWVYGYSIDVLGVVIERVTGQSLDRFLRERLFEPLGMVDTCFYLPPAKRARLAKVWSPKEGGGLELAPDPGVGIGQGLYVDGPRKAFSGGGGLLSTAGDYARFLQMMLNGGTLDGQRLLSRKTVELMTADFTGPIPDRPGRGWGLGFEIATDLGRRGLPGSLGDYGWGGAYNTYYWVDPKEDLLVVYQTQVIPPSGIKDFETLRGLVYQAIRE
ncbi:MAG: serine hydrolase domain-containing protein [Steroidobacteraceae bacterium]